MKNAKVIIGLICIIGGSILFKTYYKETKEVEGIKYKITVGGVSQSSFPARNDSRGPFTVTTDCGTTPSNWNYSAWKLNIDNNTSSTACNITFTQRGSNDYLNSYIISKIGDTSGVAGATTAKGQIVNENGIRYEGSAPYNYVLFNNELWRVIGVFAFNKSTNVEVLGGSTDCNTYNCYTKIIRDESLGMYSYSYGGSDFHNYWQTTYGSKAILNTLLNTYYYNATDATGEYSCKSANVARNCNFTSSGIQDAYRPMVQNVVWNLGQIDTSNADASYTKERGTTVLSGNATTASGYIGLMYASDYGYSVLANDGDTNCARTVKFSSYNTAECAGKAWMLQNGNEWTITPNASQDQYTWRLSYTGTISTSLSWCGISVRPVLYLSSDVYIVQGSGTKSDPYVLGM